MRTKQSGVEFLIEQLFELRNPTLNQIEIMEQAKEIEEQKKVEFAIQFAEWCCAKNMGVSKFTLFKGELEQFKKLKGL